MELRKLVASVVLVMLLLHHAHVAEGGDSGVSIPLQLVAFPALIAMTRMVKFVKRLRYVLDPATYRARSRRELTRVSPDAFDAAEVDKHIVAELGSRACVYERVCAHYAARAQALPRPQMDWANVLSQYKRSPDQTKEFFLLSVFLGDIVGSPALCHQLGKRRGCDPAALR